MSWRRREQEMEEVGRGILYAAQFLVFMLALLILAEVAYQ